jgi:hypothetical protein
MSQCGLKYGDKHVQIFKSILTKSLKMNIKIEHNFHSIKQWLKHEQVY